MSMRKSDTHPGHYIKAWRKKARLSQEKVGEYIGVTHGAVSQLERGIINYTQETLERLSELFGCTPAELLIGPPETIEQLRLLRHVEEAWSLFGKLSETRQIRIVEQIEDAAQIEGKLAHPASDPGIDGQKPEENGRR